MDFFTSDEGTQKALLEIASLLVVSQPLNSLLFAADGVLSGGMGSPSSWDLQSTVLRGVGGTDSPPGDARDPLGGPNRRCRGVDLAPGRVVLGVIAGAIRAMTRCNAT